MSGKLKFILSSVLLLMISHSAFASQQRLEQIQQDVSDVMTQLLQNPMSNAQRLQIIANTKVEAESQIRDLIMNNQVSPAALGHPKSPLSLTFRVIDGLTILTEVKLDSKTQLGSAASCGRALSMLTVISTTPQTETLDASVIDQNAKRLLSLLCKAD